MISQRYQEGLNEVVSAFAEGVVSEAAKQTGLEDAESSVVAALIDTAVAMMLRRGMAQEDISQVIENHAHLLRDVERGRKPVGAVH